MDSNTPPDSEAEASDEAPIESSPQTTSQPDDETSQTNGTEAEANDEPLPSITASPPETVVSKQPEELIQASSIAATSSAGEPKKGFRAWFSGQHFWRKVALICAVIIVLIGASAAAFVTLYLPNQPWYMLDTALQDTMSQTSFTANMTSLINSPGGGLTINANSQIAVNLVGKTIDVKATPQIGGSSILAQFRIVNNNLYMNVNLSGASSLVGLSGSVYASLFQVIANALSNRWIVFNSSLLEQSKDLRCLLSSSWVLSNSDSNYLVNSYMKKPFLKVTKATSDTVLGVASEKLSVLMNTNEATSYLNGLSNLQAVKRFASCTGGSTTSFNTKMLANNQSIPLTIWINKSNHLINKLQLTASGALAKTVGFAGTVTITINYAPVTTQAPAQAIPFTQLLLQLESQLKANPNQQSLSPVLKGINSFVSQKP
jgi:hypothetical protein